MSDRETNTEKETCEVSVKVWQGGNKTGKETAGSQGRGKLEEARDKSGDHEWMREVRQGMLPGRDMKRRQGRVKLIAEAAEHGKRHDKESAEKEGDETGGQRSKLRETERDGVMYCLIRAENTTVIVGHQRTHTLTTPILSQGYSSLPLSLCSVCFSFTFCVLVLLLTLSLSSHRYSTSPNLFCQFLMLHHS